MSEQEMPESLRYPGFGADMWNLPGFAISGYSAGGLPIRSVKCTGSGRGRTLLIGGVHGNETEGLAVLAGFLREFVLSPDAPLPPCETLVIPVLNPDGAISHQRKNGNSVDLNRNMSTKDWQASGDSTAKYYSGSAPDSEPETRLLIDLIESYQPDLIISVHSWKPMVNVNGPAQTFAQAISGKTGYVVTEDIGYPTPGSLGTWAGWERSIPTITLEMERGMDLTQAYAAARNGILAAMQLLNDYSPMP